MDGEPEGQGPRVPPALERVRQQHERAREAARNGETDSDGVYARIPRSSWYMCRRLVCACVAVESRWGHRQPNNSQTGKQIAVECERGCEQRKLSRRGARDRGKDEISKCVRSISIMWLGFFFIWYYLLLLALWSRGSGVGFGESRRRVNGRTGALDVDCKANPKSNTSNGGGWRIVSNEPKGCLACRLIRRSCVWVELEGPGGSQWGSTGSDNATSRATARFRFRIL